MRTSGCSPFDFAVFPAEEENAASDRNDGRDTRHKQRDMTVRTKSDRRETGTGDHLLMNQTHGPVEHVIHAENMGL